MMIVGLLASTDHSFLIQFKYQNDKNDENRGKLFYFHSKVTHKAIYSKITQFIYLRIHSNLFLSKFLWPNDNLHSIRSMSSRGDKKKCVLMNVATIFPAANRCGGATQNPLFVSFFFLIFQTTIKQNPIATTRESKIKVSLFFSFRFENRK